MSGITNQFAASFPSYKSLQSEMDINYRTAIAYYKQREAIFEQVLQAKAVDSLAAFQEIMEQKVEQFSDSIVATASDAIKSAFNSGILQQKQAQHKAKVSKSKKYTYEMAVSDLISQGYAYRTRAGTVNAGSRLGFPFEKWLAEGIFTTENEDAVYQLAKSLGLQVTGKIKNIASTIARKGDVRSDIAMTADGKTIGENTQFEMTSVLNIEDFRKYGDAAAGQMLLDSILSGQYGNIDANNLFGFQVKAYKDSDSTRWQQSVPLAKSLNDIFSNSNSSGSAPVTWDSNYAAMYPYYFLSKFILNIVNPVNIGVITLNGLEYTSDFLQHYRFYMEVAWNWRLRASQERASASRGGGTEVLDVRVIGTTVMLREVKAGGTLKVMAQNIKSKQRDITRKVAEVKYV